MVVCHLGLHIRGRQHELEQVLKGCNSFNLPYLLVGDLNEEPGGPVWDRLAAEGLTDLGVDAGPTFHSNNPVKRIDGALLSPGLDGRVIPLDSIEGVTRDDLAAGLRPPADAGRDHPALNSVRGLVTASRQRFRCPVAWRR